MNKLFRNYNKNRYIILLSVAMVIIIILIMKDLRNPKSTVNVNENYTSNYVDYNGNVESTNLSAESTDNNTNVTTSFFENSSENKEIEKNLNILTDFINLCNDNNIEGAYQLLSSKCKEKLYPTITDFQEKYYNKNFDTKKIYDIEGMVSNYNYYTYKVNLQEDILSTGLESKATIEDYYTIIYENNTYKLNIGGYITTEEFENKNSSNEYISVTVLSRDIYVDYEIYNLRVENKTIRSIALDSLENTDKMYLKDVDGIKYMSYSHELISEELRVKSIKNISIKYNKRFLTQKYIAGMVFEDIILDYDSYMKYTDKSEFKDRISLEITF